MRTQNIAIMGFVGAITILSALSSGAAQVRRAPAVPAETKVDLAIALQVAGQPYRFDGKAACQHAAVASIYNVTAEMWAVRQSDAQRSIMLTIWRPKNKTGDLFSLMVTSGGKSYVVNTISIGGSGTVQGSGKVTLTPSGPGGMFTMGATAANGAAITGTIKCSAFTAANAEGGN